MTSLVIKQLRGNNHCKKGQSTSTHGKAQIGAVNPLMKLENIISTWPTTFFGAEPSSKRRMQLFKATLTILIASAADTSSDDFESRIFTANPSPAPSPLPYPKPTSNPTPAPSFTPTRVPACPYGAPWPHRDWVDRISSAQDVPCSRAESSTLATIRELTADVKELVHLRSLSRRASSIKIIDATLLEKESKLSVLVTQVETNILQAPPHAAGLGSQIHAFANYLGFAMHVGIPLEFDPSSAFGGETSCYSSDISHRGLGCYFEETRSQCEFVARTDIIHSKYDAHMHSRALEFNSVLPEGFKGHDLQWKTEVSTFLFQRLRPWVTKLACKERFRIRLDTPDITVHVRWGDKAKEAAPQPIAAYVRAVKDVILTFRLRRRVSILIISEDLRALENFERLADPAWRIWSTDMLGGIPKTKNISEVDAALFSATPSLVGLLMSLEAKHIVGTLTSNWSRLLNGLRQTRKQYLLSGACSKTGDETCISSFTDLSSGKRTINRWASSDFLA